MRSLHSLVVLAVCTLASVLVLSACGDRGGEAPSEEFRWPAGWPSVQARTLEAAYLPTPYSSEQLRDSTPEGMRAYYRVDESQQEAHLVVFAFDECDEHSLVLTIGRLDMEEKVAGVPQARKMTWEDLQAHHSVAAQGTVLTRERITVPAGTFDCVLYTTTRVAQGGGPEDRAGEGSEQDGAEGESTVEQFWFPLGAPGPFVRRLTSVDGETVREMTLVRVDRRAEDK